MHNVNCPTVLVIKSAASDKQIAEALSSAGQLIAGAGGNKEFRDVQRIVDTYGGEAEDWGKFSITKYVAPDGSKYEIHYVKNIRTGQVVEVKSAITRFPGGIRNTAR